MTPSPGSVIYYNGSQNSEKHVYWLTVRAKRQEQSGEKVHRAKSVRDPSAEASVPVDWSVPLSQPVDVSANPEVLQAP